MDQCFDHVLSCRLLLNNLEAIWSGEAEQQAKPQTGTPSVAPKLDRRESKLDWSDDARTIHNKVITDQAYTHHEYCPTLKSLPDSFLAPFNPQSLVLLNNLSVW